MPAEVSIRNNTVYCDGKAVATGNNLILRDNRVYDGNRLLLDLNTLDRNTGKKSFIQSVSNSSFTQNF